MKPSEIVDTTCQRLRAAGLTIKQACTAAGVSPVVVSRWRHGVSVPRRAGLAHFVCVSAQLIEEAKK